MSFLSKSLTLMTLGLAFTAQAMAADSVVVPLYSPNLNSSKVGNITSLITSEVDFSGRYDMVSQATQRPSTLTPKCLKSVSCLRPIAQKEGVDAMITGSVTKVGNELEFFIILYERSMIIRMKRFRIEDSPLAVAANVGGYIQEVVTGQAPAVEEDPINDVPLSNALDEEGDIFGGEEDPLDFSLDPEEEARKEAAARAEEERLAEEARQAEEARRKQEMEEQARRLAMEAEAARLAAEANQATEEDDFDFDDRIFRPSVVRDVNAFLKKSTFDVFNFGGFGVMSVLSTSMKFPKWSLLTVVHAVVYSKNGRRIMNQAYMENPNSKFHDTFHNAWRANIYSYYKPLLYQTWPLSENQVETWGKIPFMKVVMKASKLLQLDKKAQPGFDVLCTFHWLVYLLQVYVLWYILQRVYKKIMHKV